MSIFYLSLGSNIQPEKNVPACFDLLKTELAVQAISPIYETEPVGPAGCQKFWNAAVAVQSEESRENLSRHLRSIEARLGRTRSAANRFAPRTIDIDLLPQPGYQKLAFIMIPLAEIAPQERDPETGKCFAVLAEGLSLQGLQKINSF
jgi:2-amino-4-hydroxy-6-hydroxymethyldihydropteridine diphosphokinase